MTRRPRLFLDVMLGKLTTYLRMCGYDAAYALDRGVEDDGKILELAESENRTVVTRDVQLAERAEDSVCIESLDVEDQLRELRKYGFSLSLTESARCSDCNGELVRERWTNEDRPEHVPGGKTVWRCRDCGKYFWKGSHWESVERTLADL